MSEQRVIKKISTAADLSDQWDPLTKAYFQSREFLLYAEKYNFSKQRYYEFYSGGALKAGAVVYSLRLDFLTYLHIPSPVEFQIIGIPVSISSPGLIGDRESIQSLSKEIMGQEKGLILGLNVDNSIEVPGTAVMDTLPTIVMEHNCASWEDYLLSLRSDYRRRLKKSIELFEDPDIRVIEGDCSLLTEEMYGQYLSIYNKTKTKLEKLSYEFFKNLPGNFRLTAYVYKRQLLTWHINTRDTDTLYFFFGGLNYSLNNRFHSYFNNLSGIVREAIDLGYRKIDFGQTAEIPKTRMGGKIVQKKMFLYHKNKLLQGIFNLAGGILEYTYDVPDVKVFKGDRPSAIHGVA